MITTKSWLLTSFYGEEARNDARILKIETRVSSIRKQDSIQASSTITHLNLFRSINLAV